MLTIYGKPHARGGFCDGVSRRDFLTIGGTLLGGALALPNLLAAEAQAGVKSHRSIINIYLPGGPPHQDMWDLKPDAPIDIRGEFKPIATKVPGIQICELFPRIAAMMDKFAIIRSLVGSSGEHDAYQCMTGRPRTPANNGFWPSLGAWVSKAQGPADSSVPAHVTLMYPTGERRWGFPGEGGFLGIPHAPFKLVGGRGTGMKSDNLVLNGITLDRLNDRVELLKGFDDLDRKLDSNGVMTGMDSLNRQALDILTTSRLKDAIDLSKEDPKVLARYGVDNPEFERDGAPRMVRNFCVARRLVEAGARVVTLNFTRWDWHGTDGKNFVQARKDFPLLDVAVSTLIEDIYDRGMERDVTVIVWGEFGRTPKINKDAGRDHWPQLSCALMAGGGMKTGQVIGASDRLGGRATSRPVTHQDIFATMYKNMGIDVNNVREYDANGRPHFPIDGDAKPIRELVG